MESGAKEQRPALAGGWLAQLEVHPVRRIVAEPAKGSMTVAELALALSKPEALIGYHRRVLNLADAHRR
jgi:hypothetical protein